MILTKKGLGTWTKNWGGAVGLKDPKAGNLEGDGRLGNLLGSSRTENLLSWGIEELGVFFLTGDGGRIAFLTG